MRSAVALSVLALVGYAQAHTLVYGVHVNGADQGDGRNRYIRSPPNNNPVKDVRSDAIACNVNGGSAVGSFVSVAAGDRVTFEWYHNSRNDDIIDPSHHGAVLSWIAPYTSGNPTGAVWTKIGQDGLQGTTSWAVDRMISNRGKVDTTLPGCLAPGRYLLKQEIIALHEADTDYTTNSARGAQFYPACVQIEVTRGGSTAPPGNFDFNSYSPRDPGILFNLYQCPGQSAGIYTYGCFGSYTIPGPAPWTCSGGTNPPVTQTTSSGPAPTTSTPSSGGGTVPRYGQCGGQGWTGGTTCAEGTCQAQNQWYSQCL